MRPLPPAPRPGDPISANLIRDILRAIQERTPRNGSNTRVGSIGPNGFTIDAVASAGAVSSRLPQPFDIEKVEEDDGGSYTISFKRPYFMIGGDIQICSGEEEGVADLEEAEFPCIVYIEVDAENGSPILNTCADIEEFLVLQEDHSKYMIPLYEFGEEGEIVCDFRSIPTANMGEF